MEEERGNESYGSEGKGSWKLRRAEVGKWGEEKLEKRGGDVGQWGKGKLENKERVSWKMRKGVLGEIIAGKWVQLEEIRENEVWGSRWNEGRKTRGKRWEIMKGEACEVKVNEEKESIVIGGE